MIMLISASHEDARAYGVLFEHTVESKCIDWLIPGNKASEVSSQIIDVFASADICKKIAADDRVLRLAQSFFGSRPGIKNRSITG